MTFNEFKLYKLSVVSKTNGSNIHNVSNLLGCMETIFYTFPNELELIEECKTKIGVLLFNC